LSRSRNKEGSKTKQINNKETGFKNSPIQGKWRAQALALVSLLSRGVVWASLILGAVYVDFLNVGAVSQATWEVNSTL
jgi:hypothetical protein